jgi:ABC-2 type transport system permease protein
MKNVATLAGKELRLYFTSPIVYVVAAVFLAISDYLFYSQTIFASSISMQMMRAQGSLPGINLHKMIFVGTFMNMAVILLLMMPLLTMRLFAEEKKTRTLDLLMTSPVSLTEIVFGKFCAAWIVYLFLLALTLHLPLALASIAPVVWAPLASAYLGLVLMGGMFLAMGLFASALTENQIIAAVVSFGLLIGFWLVGATASPDPDSVATEIVHYFSMLSHLENLIKGLVDTRDLAYFASMTGLGLFLTHRVLESQRWK